MSYVTLQLTNDFGWSNNEMLLVSNCDYQFEFRDHKEMIR